MKKSIGLALFVYKRPWHTQKVINSIKRNHFDKLYVFQDGLKDEKDRQDWDKVSHIIEQIDFVPKELHKAKFNNGLANSIIQGMNYIFQRHDVGIALEDDVVLADGYKQFIEAALDFYRNNHQVFSVSGGSNGLVIPDEYSYDVYYTYRMSSVAFATWKDRWTGFTRDPMLLRSIKSDSEKKEFLRCSGTDIERMLVDSVRGENDTWATYWQLHQINHKAYHIVPVEYFAKDIGRDGTGTNSTCASNKYVTPLSNVVKNDFLFPGDILIEPEITMDGIDLYDVPASRDESNFQLLYKYIKMKQLGREINDYFELHNIKKIYVFGTGFVSQLFHSDLKKSGKLQGYLVSDVNSSGKVFWGEPVLELGTNIVDEDILIVVVPGHVMGDIRHLSRKYKINNHFITLEKVIDSLLTE